jgi:predicted PurR-regulated permease PerM
MLKTGIFEIQNEIENYVMKSDDKQDSYKLPENKVIHYALQLLALSLLIYFCFEIIKPFVILLIWASVLAITLYPLHKKFTKLLKGRKWISATIITIIMFLFIVGPATMLILATVDEFKVLNKAYSEGNMQIPPPDESVKEWPVIGDKLFELWADASANITGFLGKHAEDIKPYALKLLDLLSSAGMGILLLMASILVAGVLMVFGEQGAGFAKLFFARLVGKRGEVMEQSVAITVRNVAKGVIGVAFIQGIMAGIGLVVAGVPLAGLWALIGMVLCIVQIGMMPVSIGVIIFIWSTAETTTAILLTIWMLFIGIIDNILKPLMMGLGAPAPMLVVFMGTIGGFIFNGFIGLFTGAIILTLGYQLLMGWLKSKPEEKV